MRIAVRVDASPRLGIGHLMRCLTLADALKAKGADVVFLSREPSASGCAAVAARGHGMRALPPSPPPAREGGPAGRAAHEAAEEADAQASAAALAGARCDWVVVDHYGLGEAWEERIRPWTRRILAIDDLADRPHACDVLLDQNHLEAGEARYAEKVPATCDLLIGPRFALLRPEYAEHRERVRPRQVPPRRIFVFFGGADPYGLTAMALDALSHAALRHLAVDVVADGQPSLRSALERLARERPGTAIYPLRPHLADLMLAADLALGAGGSTTWERLCLGLPSLVVTVAPNQVHVADWLAHEGLIRLLGRAEAMTPGGLQRALLDEIGGRRPPVRLEEGMRICDGAGADRVAAILLRRAAA